MGYFSYTKYSSCGDWGRFKSYSTDGKFDWRDCKWSCDDKQSYWSDKVGKGCSDDDTPEPDTCDGGTVVLIDENFDSGKIGDIDSIKSDGDWKVKNDALYTNGCNDGVLKFAPAELSGQTEAALSFRIKTPCIDPFESADSLKVVLVVDGETIVLDEFRLSGGEFKGSVSGMTFGETYTDLSYAAIDLPEGAEKIQIKFISSISARNEVIQIDDVKLTATGDACSDCPDGYTKISFNDLPRGTVVTDQYEGVTITAVANGNNKNNVFVIEAEDFDTITSASVVQNCWASDGEHVKTGSYGELETAFTGPTDSYKIAIDIQDECDGAGIVDVLVNGVNVGSFEVSGKEGGSGWTNGRDWGGEFSTFVLPNAIDIAQGDTVTIVYNDSNGGELGRIDKVSFIDQTIESQAMIFDTDNISGGDSDLSIGDGNVLIISEDNDSSDPDDNGKGGTLTFDFDDPTNVSSIVVIDTEEGGEINAYDADGNLIGSVDIPNLQDNTKATVDLGFEGVSKLEVVLDGSGAVDDLCYDDDDGPNGGNDPMTAQLGDTLFVDADRDGRQGDAVNAVAAGVTVYLLDADQNVLQSQTTAANGTYLFDNLAAGTYFVDFDEVAGFDFTTQNVGDTIGDSNVDANGLSEAINLAIGESNLTIDAGLVRENVDPETVDDAGMICANEVLEINALENDSDADGDTLSITQISGQSVNDGDTILLNGTATVNGSSVAFTGLSATLTGGTVSFDGEAAFFDLDIGEKAELSISYTVEDGETGSAQGSMDLTFCGVAETVDELAASLPTGELIFQLLDETNPIATAPTPEDVFTVQLSGSGDARFDGVVFEQAYCASAFDPYLFGDGGTDINLAPQVPVTISLLDDSSTLGGSNNSNVGTGELDNMINWILNQDFNSATYAGTFTNGVIDSEVQSAIWTLTDSIVFNIQGLGENADIIAIRDLALQNGDFETGPGGKVGLYIAPTDEAVDAGHSQPFIVAIDFDSYDCLC